MGGRTLDFLSQQFEEAVEKNAISFDNDTKFNLHGSGYALTFIFGKQVRETNWLAEREHFRKSTLSNQTELNHTKPS